MHVIISSLVVPVYRLQQFLGRPSRSQQREELSTPLQQSFSTELFCPVHSDPKSHIYNVANHKTANCLGITEQQCTTQNDMGLLLLFAIQ